MNQTLVNFRIDTDLKEKLEKTCDDLGITMTNAFVMFAKKMTREQRIPFEVSVNSFYDVENVEKIKKIISEVETKKNMEKNKSINDVVDREVEFVKNNNLMEGLVMDEEDIKNCKDVLLGKVDVEDIIKDYKRRYAEK